MKTKIVVPFLLAAILSACASSNDGKNVAARTSNDDEVVYRTGSLLPHKVTPADPTVTTVDQDSVENLHEAIQSSVIPKRLGQ